MFVICNSSRIIISLSIRTSDGEVRSLSRAIFSGTRVFKETRDKKEENEGERGRGLDDVGRSKKSSRAKGRPGVVSESERRVASSLVLAK